MGKTEPNCDTDTITAIKRGWVLGCTYGCTCYISSGPRYLDLDSRIWIGYSVAPGTLFFGALYPRTPPQSGNDTAKSSSRLESTKKVRGRVTGFHTTYLHSSDSLLNIDDDTFTTDSETNSLAASKVHVPYGIPPKPRTPTSNDSRSPGVDTVTEVQTTDCTGLGPTKVYHPHPRRAAVFTFLLSHTHYHHHQQQQPPIILATDVFHMSLPLPNPENAAPLPVSVEPVPVPGQDQGQSTPNPAPAVAALPAVAVAPPATDAPPAEATAGRGETALAELHLAAQTTATTPASASASASAPAPARLATESHAAADQNKKRSKGPPSGSASTSAPAPAPLVKRSSGPSLLTQALASARGIFTSGSDKPVEAPLASPRLKSHTYDLATGSHPKQDPDQPSDTQPLDTNHDLNYESDGNSLTPRGSPRPATAMTPTATVSTTAVLSSSTRESFGSHTLNNTLDLGDVNSVLNGHRHFLRSRVRGTSLERTEKERRVSVGRAYSETSAPLAVTSPAITDQARDDAEIKAQVRPRKPENMLSLGPEKIWSIGSEDLNSGQDGQVEKSITEVLAGVEPNARSRKASHSLRFFKEGLPEEKLKRRESRLGPNPRGTLSPPSEINTAKDGGQARESTRSLLPSPALPDDLPGRLTRVRTFPMQSPATPTINESPDDYFDVPRMEKGTIELEKDQTRPPTERPEAEGPSSSSNGSPCAVKNVREEHRESSDKVEGGEHVEDGEDSGEEKISSAVFLPHQGLEQSSEHSQDSEEDLHIPKSGRTQSRAEGFHPWLVKADEPEPETVENPAKEQLREIESKSLEGLPPTEPSPQLFGEQNVSDERDFAIPSTPKSSHLAAQHYEEHVHDHQLAPKQPLDAIELIPYKHQVGGHTTIWRFSRRAVCKQLNNRENEFYETVERYHRDLLAFLPRYVWRGLLISPDMCPWCLWGSDVYDGSTYEHDADMTLGTSVC